MVDYEISIWDDIVTVEDGTPLLKEQRISVIGSNNMHTGLRAIEPKLVDKLNGTHTFTFKMYQYYIDPITGKEILNPYLPYLVNERKIKVRWGKHLKDDKTYEPIWYDFLIKNIQEDTSTRAITYTCEDLFITELSKNGYNLEFSADLQNNIGTAKELVENVLKDTDWQYDEDSDEIYQNIEEAVYYVKVKKEFTAELQSTKEDKDGSVVTIPKDQYILMFYSSVVGLSDGTSQNIDLQFAYKKDKDYQAEIEKTDEMLVRDVDCYILKGVTVTRDNNFTVKKNNDILFSFNLNSVSSTGRLEDEENKISTLFRANRLVQNQQMRFDNVLGRYVNVYKPIHTGKDLLGFSTTEFSNPSIIINLITNPNTFTKTSGWYYANSTDEVEREVYPEWTSSSEPDPSFQCKGYLKFDKLLYNNAFASNTSYFSPKRSDIVNGNIGGVAKDDKYIYRIKMYDGLGSTMQQINEEGYLNISVYKYDDNTNYKPKGNNFITSKFLSFTEDKWLEYEITFNSSCSGEDIKNLGLYISPVFKNNNDEDAAYYIEEAQFFKLDYGTTDGTNKVRMEPDHVETKGIAKTIFKFYEPDSSITDPSQMTYIYSGPDDKTGVYIPELTQYEKFTSIEEKGSNRFNILQSIAKAFKCWIRFEIEHDPDTGKIKTVEKDGVTVPVKKVRLYREIGQDLGWSFIYGIDLKNIQRKIVSDKLVTKTIVLSNSNQFGKNGICTISRSNYNPTKDNFILNFDYYIQSNLLDARIVYSDLYGRNQYYQKLYKLNGEYNSLVPKLAEYKNELIKVDAAYETVNKRIKSITDEITKLNQMIEDRRKKGYGKDSDKIKSLQESIGVFNTQKAECESQIKILTAAKTSLQKDITTIEERLKTIIDSVTKLHNSLFNKYYRYIQEGTWQDENYVDDDKYYIDATNVAYESSKPKISYTINVMRLNSLEEFSSKQFEVGDSCYIEDTTYFGYKEDKITPRKVEIIISEITSNFDSPEKDVIKVQTFKDQFDDLFQSITATTQSLQYSEGSFKRAAAAVNTNRSINQNSLQSTFDNNAGLSWSTANNQVEWNSEGVLVQDEKDTGTKIQITAGNIYTTRDGGISWSNLLNDNNDLTSIGGWSTLDNSLYTNGVSLNAAKSSTEGGSIEVGNIKIYANGDNIRFAQGTQIAEFTITQLQKLANLNIP